jgi:flagellar basal-body rod protein FlgC
MDLSIPFAISTSGLQPQRLRMNVISSNLANMQSTHTAEGGRTDVHSDPAPAGRECTWGTAESEAQSSSKLSVNTSGVGQSI